MEKKAFNLNQDHQRLSLIIPVILLVLIVVTYRIFYLTMPSVFGGRSSDYLLIAGLCALFGSAFVLWLIDPFLKRIFPSGHVLTVDPQAKTMTYALQEEIKEVLTHQEDWQVIRWYFRMGRFVKSGRERQIPKSWFCLSMSLKSGGNELILFCYVRPYQQRNFTTISSWSEISMVETLEESQTSKIPMMRPPTLSPSIPSRLLVGDNGHVWLAERNRREEGLEMSPSDFRKLLEYLEQ